MDRARKHCSTGQARTTDEPQPVSPGIRAFAEQGEAYVWTQRIYRHTRKFQNPLRQNFKHVEALKTLLGIPPETMHSVIVFVGGSTFKTNMPANVTHAGGYVRYIKSFK